MTGDVIFSAKNVNKSFGSFRALSGVSIDLLAGERRALIGPNGAGKSTFINIVGGQLAGDKNSQIHFEDREISGYQPDRISRSGIARTFQVSRVYGTLTVYENVLSALLTSSGRSFSLAPSHMTDLSDQVFAQLEQISLADFAHSAAEDISHGDRKRLEFGMAMTGKPRLLLLDEPTAGMGLKERHELMEFVVEHVGLHGITLLFVEHDIDVVFKVAERITVMALGQVFAEGSPDEIAANQEVQDIYLGTSHAAD
jgi:branched-chain amino acid transport system ATP-binding protein